jgi:hypothetical protein
MWIVMGLVFWLASHIFIATTAYAAERADLVVVNIALIFTVFFSALSMTCFLNA